jgi:hypothetical protein
MKKKNFIKTIIAFFLISIFSISGILAYDGYKTIQVHYQNIKILINGRLVFPEIEPFTYNGRTLVPLRFIAESLNKEITWDDFTKTIEIYDKITPSTLPIIMKGSGKQATELFSLEKGLFVFEYSYSGEERSLYIKLLDYDGNYMESIAIEYSNTLINGSKAVQITNKGQYLLNIDAGEGNWEVRITKK